MRLDLIERHPYTLELRLTYELCDPVTGRPDPSAFLRTYRDARLAEVTHCYVGRRWQDALELHPSARTVLAHRLQMNAFLNKWLDYLADQGHSRATLQPIEALSMDASDDERRARFEARMRAEFRAHMNEQQSAAYESAAGFQLMWAGLARYWRKKEALKAV